MNSFDSLETSVDVRRGMCDQRVRMCIGNLCDDNTDDVVWISS
jgi:hypothetical protein